MLNNFDFFDFMDQFAETFTKELDFDDLFSLSKVSKNGNILYKKIMNNKILTVDCEYTVSKFTSETLSLFKGFKLFGLDVSSSILKHLQGAQFYHIANYDLDYEDLKYISGAKEYIIHCVDRNLNDNFKYIMGAERYELYGDIGHIMNDDVLKYLANAKEYSLSYIMGFTDEAFKYISGGIKYELKGLDIGENALKYIRGAKSYKLEYIDCINKTSFKYIKDAYNYEIKNCKNFVNQHK